MECIPTVMVIFIRDFGRQIKKTEMDNTHLLMEMYIRDSLRKELEMAMVFLDGSRVTHMKATSTEAIRTEKEF